ncbi:MAG: PAS domain S-box protein [Candidatus Dadabacteria bacterium]|nr:MAG: PAS domain S-box protein [Candidatus Dadabacteria bacterium]
MMVTKALNIGVICSDEDFSLIAKTGSELKRYRLNLTRLSPEEMSGFKELNDLLIISDESKNLDLLRAILSGNLNGNSIPVILLTSDHNIENDLNLFSVHTVDYLLREFVTPNELERTLALVEQRQKQQEELDFLHRFERLIAEISAGFINTEFQKIDSAINSALSRIGKFAGADRSYVLWINQRNQTWSMIHEWHTENVPSASDFYRDIPLDSLGNLFKLFSQGTPVHFNDIDSLPDSEIKHVLISRGVKSVIVVPMLSNGVFRGGLGLSSLREKKNWPPRLVNVIEFLGGIIVNTLERKSADKKRYDSELRYRTLIESLGEGIILTDCNEKILHVNSKLCELTGYSSEELIGRHTYKVLFPDIGEKFLEERTSRRLQGIEECYSIETTRKDGSKFWAEISASPVRNSEGVIIGTLGAITDITGRYLAQKALANQKQFLQDVVDANPNYIFTRNKHGRYTFANQAVADLYGISKEELIGKSPYELADDHEIISRFLEEDQEVLKSGKALVKEAEALIHPRTEEKRWVQTVKQPLREPESGESQVLTVLTDITDRMRSEKTLRDILEGTAAHTGQDFFSSLAKTLTEVFDASTAIVGRFQTNGAHKVVNLALHHNGSPLDIDEYPIEGTPCEMLLTEDYYICTTDLASSFPRASLAPELDVNSYIGVPIIGSAGQRIGLLSVMDKKPLIPWPSAKSILQIFASRAAAEIERIDSEKERDKLQRQLYQSQKMTAVGQLAAGIAHDLNNALSAVVGHLQLLKRDNVLDGELKSSVDIALRGCERSSSLIEQLLGFARQGKYNLKQLELKKVLCETTAFLDKIIGKNVNISVKDAPAQLYVAVDQAQIQQALTNLIINASQAMPQGGEITISLDVEEINSPERFNPKAKSGRYACLSIRDTGTGIPAEQLDKIFEPFFTTKQNGTGLGLSMVYGVMQNHGGWIEADSEPGKGTIMKLYFPLVRAPLKIVTPDKPAMNENRASGNVLVIDDEPFLVDLALKFLEKNGLNGKGFTSAADAINWYRENHKDTDLIILDLKMPEMDGKECFDKLCQINPAAKVILLSGYIDEQAVQELLSKGAVEFFQKPVKYPELVAWIKRYISQAQPESASNR